MALHLKPPAKVNRFPDTQRIRRAFYRSLPKTMRYSVESLEPRYLLSAAPVPPIVTTPPNNTLNGGIALTNLSTPGDATNTTNTTQVANAIKTIIGKLSYLGQQVDKDSLTSTPIPLLNQTIGQLNGSGTTMGDSLFSNANTLSGLDSVITSAFSAAATTGGILYSSTLATDLQALLNGTAPGLTQDGVNTSYLVTDESSNGMLDLQFSLTTSTNSSPGIVLGNAAQQFNLAPVATSADPTATMTTTTTSLFDIKADFSLSNSDTGSVFTQLGDYDSSNTETTTQLQTQLVGDFSFNPHTFDRTELVAQEGSAGGYLPDFGVQFGVMGAGDPNVAAPVDGAYTNGATFDFDVDTQVNFTAASTAGGSINTAAFTVDFPVGDAVAGTKALTNEASLNLPIDVYDVIPTGSTSAANDAAYIAGLAGVTGTFTITDANLTDGTTPLVSASSVELASFARLTPASIVAMAQESAYLAGDLDQSQLTSDLPFLSLTQGNAYDFQTALQNAFVNALQSTSVVLQATNAPSVIDATYPAGDPSNLTGTTTFDVTLAFGTGASLHDSSAPITITTGANATLADLLTALNANTALGLASLSAAAEATLTSTANYVNGDTITLAGQTYTFKTALSASNQANQVVIGADEATSIANLAAAINGTTGAGSLYGTGTIANTHVSAVAGSDTLTVTALQQGTAGNSITVSSTAAHASFGTGVTHLSGGGTPLIQAVAVSNSGGSQTIELVSTDPTAQFFLSNFTPDATGVLDLGFNQYSNVVAQVNGTITGTGAAAFELPGIIVQSTSALSLSDFTQPVSFDVSVDGQTAVEVTIPGNVYTSAASLVSAVQQALIAAGISDGSQNGVLVQQATVGNGFGLEFYAGNYEVAGGSIVQNSNNQDVVLHSLAFTDPDPATSNFSDLYLTSPSSTAASFTVSYVEGGQSQQQTIYVNGNLTNGLLNYQSANASVGDLVSDIQLALTQAGLLNATGTEGITVTSSSDSNGEATLQFMAANPGDGTNQISSFVIKDVTDAVSAATGTNSLSSILLGTNPATTVSSIPIALASSVTTPAFQTVQQLASLLYNLDLNGSSANTATLHGVLDGSPSFSAGTAETSPSFDFPIQINADDTSTVNGSQVLPDLNGVGLSFGSSYDDVSGLTSASTVSVSRSDAMTFSFGINLIAPAPTAEVLSASVPVTELFTNYDLTTPGQIEIMPDNGMIYTINVPAWTSPDGTAASFAAMLNGLISGVAGLGTYLASITTTTDSSGEASLVFNTVAGSTRELNVIVPATDTIAPTAESNAAWTNFGFGSGTPTSSSPEVMLSTTSTSITAANAYSLTNFTNTGFITFNLPDGDVGTLQINPVDFSGDVTAADVAATLNTEITGTASLRGTSYLELQSATPDPSTINVLPQIVATVNSSNQIVFTLNPNVYQTGVAAGSWGLTVQPQYLQDNPNSLVQNIGLPSQTVVDSSQAATGLLSTVITSDTFGTGLTSTDSFKVSINGLPAVTVNVSLNDVTSIGQLVEQLNNDIGQVNIEVNSTPIPLSDYLSAEVTNGGTQVMLRLNDSALNTVTVLVNNVAVPVPALENAAFQFQPPGGAMSILGFTPASDVTVPSGTLLPVGSRELLFTVQGSDGTIGDATFVGSAMVMPTSGDTGALFTGTADFGITAFDIGGGLLNESVSSTLSFASSTTPTLDVLVSDADANDFTSPDFGGLAQSPSPATSYAVVKLADLSFPSSLVTYQATAGGTVTPLTFNSDATITFGYGTYGAYTGPALSSFSALPAITSTYVHYFDTNNLQLLAGLDLDSIVHGLERVGDMLSDWMQNGSGPFSSPLFFELQSLVSIDNLGQDFSNAVAGILVNPPTTLESTPTAILQALQLQTSALTFNIVSDPTTGNVVLNIAFNWAETFVETLPLAIDLSNLENDSSNQTYTAPNGQTGYYGTGVINSFLLGLTTISSDPTNPININFSEVSQLGVNLNLVVAQNNAAIQPEAVVANPTAPGASFFQTNFLIDGEDLNGNLPAGAGYLSLANGSLAVDGTGQLDVSTSVLAVSNAPLPALDSGTNTITITGTTPDPTPSIGGYTPSVSDVGGDILVNDQANPTQNGLYQITSYTTASSGISTIVLTLNSAVGSIGDSTRFFVEPSTFAGQVDSGDYLGLATSGSTVFTFQAPFVYDTAAAASFTPATTQILAATSSAFNATATSTTLAGSGTLTIGGVTLGLADQGGLVLVNNQSDPTQNGLYTVTTAHGGSWLLTRSTTATNNVRFETAAGAYYEYDTTTQFARLIEPATYSYNLGNGTYVLPYTVQAATTSDLGPINFVSGTLNAPATITSQADGSLDDLQTTATEGTSTLTFTGIDDVQTLTVGSLILVKDQSNDYENGVYVVTSLGSSTAPWVLTRASFAANTSGLDSLKVDVAGGYENVDTRWAQTDTTLTGLDSSGFNVIFAQTVDLLYSTGGVNWLTFTATGQGVANLPLSIAFFTPGGSEIIVSNDLQKYDNTGAGEVTIGELQAFYATGIETVNGTTVPLNSVVVATPNGQTLTYGDFAPFAPLTLSFNLDGYNGAGPSANTPQLSVVFSSVPDIADSFVSPNAITPWQNAFYVGDALDLALFTIQSALSEALAQEFPLVGTSLSGEAEFIENFRAQFTALVRQGILNSPDTPLQDIRDAIYTAGTDQGLLQNFVSTTATSAPVTVASILVDVVTGTSEVAFPFGDYSNTSFYSENPDGTYSETTPAGANAITFAFSLGEDFNSYYTTTLNAVNLGDSSIGATITTNTEDYTTGAATTGGVTLQRSFTFNFGFGIDVALASDSTNGTSGGIDNSQTGFFIFNPTLGTWAAQNNFAPEPMIDFGFMAELNGNINAPNGAIAPFFQNSYSSEVNGLSVDVEDARLIDQTVDNPGYTGSGGYAGNDNLPSGFYGDVLLNLNFNHPLADSPVPGANYADLNDLRSVPELGPDSTNGITPAGAIFNEVINADADVDLLLQSQQQGLQPAAQADLIYDKSYGTGASPAFGLNFKNPAVVGLGNIALGIEEMNDQKTAENPGSSTTDVNNALADFNTIATEVSPVWRFADRDLSTSLLLANGGEGNTFVDYQNIKINILDYLGNVLYNALRIYEDIVAPLRPYITFLTTPIPGTTAFTSGGLTIGSLLGSQFETFISDVQEIDNLISPLAILASEDTNGSGWVPATASSIDLSALFDGAEYLGGKIADKISEKVKEKYDEYNKKQSNAENEEENNSEKTAVSSDTSTSNEEKEASAAESDIAETSSDSTSKSFNKSSSESNKESDDEESDGEEEKKPSNFSAGLSGGAILLDALDYNTMTNVFQGVDANLLRIQLPTLSVSYTFEKKIPIEAFPPLVITLSFTIGLDVTINFGWDTQGFFFNTLDLTTGDPVPLFAFSGKFAIGVGLDFGLIDAEADIYFLATVSFYWNDVSGTGKVHESDLQYLQSHGDSVFAVEVTGTVGFDFSIVLSIPIPLVGPINITIFSYNWSDTLFDVTFGKVTGQIQLGTVMAGSDGQNDVLLLNSGIYAANRLFINTNPVNEVFNLYDVSASSLGENILVVFDNEYYEEFYNIKQVIGYTGAGASQIEAGGTLAVGSGLTVTLITTTTNPTTATFTSNLGPLQYAVVDFYGGTGDTVLQAGASYNSAWGRSRLQGGTGTGTELLEANATATTAYNTSIGTEGVGVDLIAGGGPANIYGSLSGGDNIVAGQGPDLIFGSLNEHIFFETGFGNDRIYVTGGNNSVSFDGWSLDTADTGSDSTSGNTTTVVDPILTLAELAEFITALNVAPISTPLTLSFGPLVESAVSGSSTVFFATDPAEIQQINNWTGGVGGDTYDIYYFAPDQTLTLNAPVVPSNVNTFNVYFGNPNIVYRYPGNNGTINLNDTNAQDVLDITQTFPETVGTTTLASGYSANYLNGRELLNYDTNLTINYNAPNSVVVLGSLTDKVDFDPINAVSYNVGTIILISPVEFENPDVTITVKDTLDLLYDVNIVGSAGAASLFTLTVANAFPTGESDLEFEKGAVLSMSLASEANTPAANGAHDGTGTIYINLPTGSLVNYNGTTGSIVIPDGTLAISALYNIGLPENGNPDNLFSISAASFTARTTSLNDVSNRNGIFITTDGNLAITGYGALSGLNVAAGDIYVDDEGSGDTLSYYQLTAGSSAMGTLGGNITLIADHLAKVGTFTVTRDVETEVPIEEQIVTLVPVYNEVIFGLSFGDFGILTLLPFFFDYTVQVTDIVTGYQLENVPTTITLGGADDRISGTGTLTILNATSGANITVGSQSSNPASGLYLDNAILSTIATGFAGIVIGRTPPAAGSNAPTTGTVTVNAVAFDQAASVTLQGTSLDVTGSVSNSYALITPGQAAGTSPLLSTPDSLLDFNAQDGITFSSTATYAAGTIEINSGDALNLTGTFLSEAVSPVAGEGPLLNGQILVDVTGAVTLDQHATLEALHGSSNISISGASITLDPLAVIEASQTVTLTAMTGSIGYSSATPTPHSVQASAVILAAHVGIDLEIDAPTITSATAATGDIILTNTATGTLTVNAMTATLGDITLTTPGEIDLVRPGANLSAPLVMAGGSVSLTSTLGAIFGDTLYSSSTYDIEATALTLAAKDEIDSKAASSFNNGVTRIYGLVTDVGSLSATSSGTGPITILNVGSVTLNTVTTQGGPIAIYGTANLNVQGTVSTVAGANVADTILLDTEFLAAGDGSIDLGTASVQGSVEAGPAVVTLNADDAILGAAGFNLVSGSSVLLTAHGQQAVASLATDTLINVNIATQSVDANTEEAGQIFLETSDTANNLLLHDIQTFSGDITVTGTSPTPGPGVNLVTYEVNAHASNVTLDTTGTITDDTDPNVQPAGLNDITGVVLTTNSVGNTVLQTQIGYLDSFVGGVGSLTVNQGDGSQVTSAVTTDGFITINAGQATALQDYADANLLVGTITAGDGSAVNLNVIGGSIFDPTYGQNPDTSLITGGILTLTTEYGTEGNTPALVGLNTAVSQLDITGSGAGAYVTITQTGNVLVDNIDLTDGGNITLTAKSAGLSSPGTITVNNITTDTINSTVNITSVSSAIEQTVGKIIAATLEAQAGTSITALTDVNVLNADITGLSGGDIMITQDHGVAIGQVETPQGAFTLDLLAGGVTAEPESLVSPYDAPYLLPYNVEANTITINTLTGIATALQNLAVYADLVDATATSILGTGIFIHNYKIHTGADNFVADDIQALTGPVSITSAGNLLAREIEIQTDQSGNNITLVTTDSGNILINFVGTGLADAVPGVTAPNFGTFTAVSDGLINAVDPTTALVDYPVGSIDAVNIVAYGVSFNAQTGIGTPADLSPIITGKLLSAATKTGDISSGDSTSTDFYVDGYSTGMGNLGFIKGGGGNLYATGFSTLDGNVNLTVHDGATLFLGSVYAIGNVSLQMDHINFQGGADSVFGTGVLTIQPDNPGQYVQVNAYFAQTIYERSDTLEVGKIGFEAIFTDFQSIVIGNIAQPSLTYVYYYVGDPFVANSLISGTTITFGYLEANNAPPTEFQLADLFATLASQAAQGQLTEEDIQSIVDELGFTADFSSSSFDESSDSDDDDYLSDAVPGAITDQGLAAVAPADEKSPVALASAPSHDRAAVAAVEDDSSWIDRAVVVTTATAIAAKPVRRLAGLF